MGSTLSPALRFSCRTLCCRPSSGRPFMCPPWPHCTRAMHADRSPSCLRGILCVLAALSLSGVPGGSRACAQGMRGRIIGVVTDSAGALGIAGADISIDGTSIHAVSDERGGFRLIGGSGAGTVLRIRRLGFRPQTLSITSSGDVADVHIYLVPAAQFLAPVVVHGERTRYLGRLAGYHERLEKRTSGQFITRADIERDRPGG